jgi:hypothetical protein
LEQVALVAGEMVATDHQMVLAALLILVAVEAVVGESVPVVTAAQAALALSLSAT